jgi:hypothetical protein
VTALLALIVVVPPAVIIVQRESDPLVRIERQLARGESVTLIGATGLPAYYKWRHGPATLAASVRVEDGTCSFQTTGVSLLELLPDPYLDRFRIRAELRHDGTTAAPPQVGDPAAAAGRAVLRIPGSQRGPGRRDGPVLGGGLRRIVAAERTGPSRTAPGPFPGLCASQAAAGRLRCQRSQNLTRCVALRTHGRGAGHLAGGGRRSHPGVGADGVAQRRRGVGDDPPPNPRGIERRHRPAARRPRAVEPRLRHDPRPVQPRAPLGIFAWGSAVSVRNFVIEPLPR